MTKKSNVKKMVAFVSPIVLGLLSSPALSMHDFTPPGWQAYPPFHLKSTHATHTPSGLSPAQVKQAYSFPANLEGAGQVIAIIDAFDDPNIESDLAVFSTQFNLPACTTANGCFTKMYASGSQPSGNTQWGTEISLDVEWAHAIAPAAKILLIEAADNSSGLYDAINIAIQQKATVISLSWGGVEFSQETFYDSSIFGVSPVPIVAATGDTGNGVQFPAASPYVVSAGGTQLSLDSNGNYLSETAWAGSGGGISTFETEPVYQSIFPIASDTTKHRGVPDVAYNAAPNTGYSVYDSFGTGGWLVVGGTSASAPQWAALIAIMKSAKNGNFAYFNQSLYSVARTTTLLNDVSSGTNGTCGYLCTARSGYDYVTGVGSPQAANLVARFD